MRELLEQIIQNDDTSGTTTETLSNNMAAIATEATTTMTQVPTIVNLTETFIEAELNCVAWRRAKHIAGFHNGSRPSSKSSKVKWLVPWPIPLTLIGSNIFVGSAIIRCVFLHKVASHQFYSFCSLFFGFGIAHAFMGQKFPCPQLSTRHFYCFSCKGRTLNQVFDSHYW